MKEEGKKGQKYKKGYQQTILEQKQKEIEEKIKKEIENVREEEKKKKDLGEEEGNIASGVMERKVSKNDGDINRPTKRMAIASWVTGEGRGSFLKKIALVNSFQRVIYEKDIDPPATSNQISSGNNYKQVQSDVSSLIKDRYLIGYNVSDTLKGLLLSHPTKFIRDLSRFYLFKNGLESVPLASIIKEQLNLPIPPTNTVERAKACLQIYDKYKKEWEGQINKKVIQSAKEKKEESEVNPIIAASIADELDEDDDE
eukprot:TRINITY_DN600_c0_g1_i2.p1 TRINITY_DN600_c0_g1~~TRINITY_DN600_c0_g1_i2.p1  ORF type:complete len:256 (-),score=68.54 TRINITY_DN600_c0_g1_i2:464-1231(-)